MGILYGLSKDYIDFNLRDNIKILVLSKSYLPRLIPFFNTRIAHLFSIISQISMGFKSGCKSSPSSNRLLPYELLSIPTKFPFIKAKRRIELKNKLSKMKAIINI